MKINLTIKLVIALIITALVGVMAAVVTSNVMSPQTAAFPSVCDADSLRSFANNEPLTENGKLRAAVLRQEATACENSDHPSANPSQQPTKSSTSTPSPTVTVTTSAPAPTRPRVDLSNPDNWPRYERELISTRPAAEKVSLNSFGPKDALAPAFRGRQLDTLSAQQFVDELKYRMPMSPVLTAATGASLNLWPESEVNNKISLFLDNKAEWKKAVAEVSAGLDTELRKGAHIVTLPAGTYTATYAVTDQDGVPHFAVDDNVSRPAPFKVLQFTNGTSLRLICGGQQYTNQQQAAPRMPAPSPGMSRNNEGTPVVLVSVCRFVNGSWQKVFSTTRRLGDQPLDSSLCQAPPTTPPTTTHTTTLVPVCVNGGGKIAYVPPSEAHKYPKPFANGTCAKDPNHDPAQHGKAGNGSGKNQDSGPGATTTPTHAPSTTRTNPAPPPPPAPTTSQPAPPTTEVGAPASSAPATACSPPPGMKTC